MGGGESAPPPKGASPVPFLLSRGPAVSRPLLGERTKQHAIMASTLNGRLSTVMRCAVGASVSCPVLLYRRLGRRPSWTGKPRVPVLLLGLGTLRGTHLGTVPRRQPPTPSQRWNFRTQLSGRNRDRQRGGGRLRLQRLRPGLPDRSAADSNQRDSPQRG